MDKVDIVVVYYSLEVVVYKKLVFIFKEDVVVGFGGEVLVMNEIEEVLFFLCLRDWGNLVLLMMLFGNFDGIDYDKFVEELK